MERRLIKQGTTTLMVSLPVKWIKQYQLSKGSTVHLEWINNNLQISAGLITPKQEIEIELNSQTESDMRTILTNAYRNGYDKLSITVGREELLEVVSKMIESRFIGFESTEISQRKIIFENITEPSFDQFDVILRKLFFIIKESITLTESFLNGEDVSTQSESVSHRLQKFDNYCRRAIQKNHKIGSTEYYWAFLTLLVHGQRELYYLHKELPMSAANSIEILHKMRELFVIVEKMYTKQNSQLVTQIHLQHDEIAKLGKKILYDKKYASEHFIVHKLLSCARRLYQANSPLLGILLSRD